MERKLKIGLTAFLLMLIPGIILNAQEKKSEQRVKIVVADKSGTKVELDTLITGSTKADSIKLKNGEVVYLTRLGKGGIETHSEGDNKTMFVTYSKNGKGEKGEGGKENHKTITIISGDSDSNFEGGDGNEVVIIKDGKHDTGGKGGEVMSWSSSSSSGNSNGEKHIYINEDKGSVKEGKKTYEVTVTTDDKSNTVEKTKYVIAKDGMVVTIEGNDEARAKEILNEVQKKLGVDQKDKSEKKEAKKEAKKENKDTNKN